MQLRNIAAADSAAASAAAAAAICKGIQYCHEIQLAVTRPPKCAMRVIQDRIERKRYIYMCFRPGTHARNSYSCYCIGISGQALNSLTTNLHIQAVKSLTRIIQAHRKQEKQQWRKK
jgi:hypothetical protein